MRQSADGSRREGEAPAEPEATCDPVPVLRAFVVRAHVRAVYRAAFRSLSGLRSLSATDRPITQAAPISML